MSAGHRRGRSFDRDALPTPVRGRNARGSRAGPRRYADELAERLRNTPGTKRVETFGTQTEEILVTLDDDASASLGLTPDTVAAAISRADAKQQSGRLLSNTTNILLDVEGDNEEDAEEEEDLHDVIENVNCSNRFLGDWKIIQEREKSNSLVVS